MKEKLPPCLTHLATTCQRSVQEYLPCRLWQSNDCPPQFTVDELAPNGRLSPSDNLIIRKQLHTECPVSTLYKGDEYSDIHGWFMSTKNKNT